MIASSVAAALTAAILTTAVIVVLSRRRRRRRSRRAGGGGVTNGSAGRSVLDVALIVGGVVLAIGTLLAGTQLLHVRQPPGLNGRPGAIGVVPPALPNLNRGLAVALAIRVRNCSAPVEVTMGVGGTGEYWQDHGGSLPRNPSLVIALRRPRLDHVKMYEGISSEDITQPLLSFSGGDALVPLHPAATTSKFDATVLRVRTPDWGQHQYAVVTTFRAHWLYPRSLGTCYLALPTLAGGDTLFPAEEARGQASWDPNASFGNRYQIIDTDNTTTLTVPDDPRLQTVVGGTTVEVDHGDVETQLSLPAPNALSNGYPRWTCENPAQQPQRLPRTGPVPQLSSIPTSTAPVLSLAGIAQDGLSDCSGLAVIAEAGSDSRLTLLLLLLGSLISLGAAVAVEVMLDWREFGLPFRRSLGAHPPVPAEDGIETPAANRATA
jgi:hypothetical protein